MNQLPTMVPKATRPTPVKPQPTVKAVNQRLNELGKAAKGVFFSELNTDQSSKTEKDMETVSVQENTAPSKNLEETIAELLENKRLKEENEHQKVQLKLLAKKLGQSQKTVNSRGSQER